MNVVLPPAGSTLQFLIPAGAASCSASLRQDLRGWVFPVNSPVPTSAVDLLAVTFRKNSFSSLQGV